MFDLMLAGAAFVAVMVYATLGVATRRISGVTLRRECVARHGEKESHNKTEGMLCGSNHDHLPGYHGFFPGIFWILFVPAVAVYFLALFLAKGPTKWGIAIAELPERHKRALNRMSPEELRQLEVECGLRDVV